MRINAAEEFDFVEIQSRWFASRTIRRGFFVAIESQHIYIRVCKQVTIEEIRTEFANLMESTFQELSEEIEEPPKRGNGSRPEGIELVSPAVNLT